MHGPRTGELVVSDGEDEVYQPASPYVTFTYSEVVGDFVYLRDTDTTQKGGVSPGRAPKSILRAGLGLGSWGVSLDHLGSP